MKNTQETENQFSEKAIEDNLVKQNPTNLFKNYTKAYVKAYTKIIDGFWEAGYSTVNAFIFTLPIIAEISEGFSPLAVFTNIIIAPLITPITILNLANLVPFLGQFLTPILIFLQSLIFILIDSLKGFSITPISQFSLVEYICYYTFWLILAFLINNRLPLKSFLLKYLDRN